jgi:hypothetical protein
MYDIEMHKHLYSAWAASRAASVKGARLSVVQGRSVLEACGFVKSFSSPDQLPTPAEIDGAHRHWRITACASSEVHISHGIAAKLINIYLKTRFVCGGNHEHERVVALHPPIDAVLLRNFGKTLKLRGFEQHQEIQSTRWTQLDSDGYEKLIDFVRNELNGEPMWMIEKYWTGNQ